MLSSIIMAIGSGAAYPLIYFALTSYDLIKEILLKRKKDIFGRVHIVIHPNQTDQVKLEV